MHSNKSTNMPTTGLEICEIVRILRNKQFCMDGLDKCKLFAGCLWGKLHANAIHQMVKRIGDINTGIIKLTW